MGRFRVYVKPFDDAGAYVADWTEVTEDIDMSGLSQMKQSLDNNEYDIGVFKNANVTLTLMNFNGTYSDVGSPGSIFKYRRSNSLVKITWEIMHHDVICGFCTCGEVALSEEVDAFVGLLDDTGLKQDADEQNIQFKVLGKESIFGEVLVPFADIAAGDTFEEILFTILNQTAITNLLTVSAINISCSVNSVTDSVAALQNKTVREALSLLLLYSNAVLYIESDTIYVAPRTATVDIKYTFYGQGALGGMENINDLSDYRIGLNRLFNFMTWKNTTLSSEEPSSITAFGYKKKEIETSLITDNTKRQAILDSIKDEFKNPKREMIIKAPIDYDTIALKVLDRIVIDYPNIPINNDADIPLWDLAVWDTAVYPYEVLPIAIESAANFKILSRDIDPANQELSFYVREI